MSYSHQTATASTHTAELSLDLHDFDDVCEDVKRHFRTREKKNGRVEIKDLEKNGIQVALIPTVFGGKAYVRINLQKIISETYQADEIIDPTDDNMEHVKQVIERNLKSIGLPNKVRGYEDEQVHLCVNITEKGNNNYAREYIRLRSKSPTPQGGTRSIFYDSRRSEKENKQCNKDYLRFDFWWGTLVLYDKKRQSMRERLVGCGKVPKGALRYELQLNRKGIRAYKDKSGLSGWALICWLSQNSGDLIYEKLNELYYSGYYLKKQALYRVIEDSDYNKAVRKQMIEYVKLAKKFGENIAAEKTMRKRKWSQSEFNRFRRRFEKIGIQPVPLRKNYHDDWLETPEESLLRLLPMERNFEDRFFVLRARKLPL